MIIGNETAKHFHFKAFSTNSFMLELACNIEYCVCKCKCEKLSIYTIFMIKI